MSRLFAPGSLAWLVLWDLRIRLREQGIGRAGLRSRLLYGALLLVLHAVAGLVLWAMLTRGRGFPPEQVLQLTSLLMLSLLFFMLMAAGLSGFRLLHAGRELTPLLISPVPFQRLLWMRVLGLVATTWAVSILLVMPIANMGAVLGHPVFLLAYPVTVALAVLTTAAVLLVVSLIVKLFGVARGRRVLQWLQALVPIGFVMASLSGQSGSGGSRGLETYAGLMRLPARALTGEPGALLPLLAFAALALGLAVRLARHSLLAVLQAPETLPSPPRERGPQALRFRLGLFRVLLLKEWRTILRDPRLAAALLVQPLLVVPAFYGALMQARFELAGLAAMAVFVSAQLSQYVANLMISAEEAPALLAAAPQARSRLIRLKCIAALLPILALMLVASSVLAWQDTWCGLVAALCCTGAAFCACAIEIVRPYPAPRRSFVQLGAARRMRDPLDILSIAVMQIGWTAGAWLLADRSLWGALLVFAMILVPFLEWWRDANRQSLLGY